MTMLENIFVPGVGQHENIGDIILRRELLDALRPSGRLHVYVGKASRSYVDALGLTNADRIYYSFPRWFANALAQASIGRASYVFKPGEIQLRGGGLKEHVVMLPVVLAARMWDKRVLRVAAGSRDFTRLGRVALIPSIKLASRVWWRDSATAKFFRGDQLPDLGFGGGTDDSAWLDRPDRPLLVVSLRGDRKVDRSAMLTDIEQVASESGLAVVVVSQVLRDNALALKVAETLHCEALVWTEGEHKQQEERLRGVYRRSALVVSDRLHVLIMGATEGALPVAVGVDGAGKIVRHFEAAGIHTSATDHLVRPTESSTLVDITANILESESDIRQSVVAARSAVRAELDHLQMMFGTLSAPTVEVLHLGREDDVAGGMTQVIRETSSWTIPGFNQSVLKTRAGRGFLRDVQLFSKATLKLVAYRRKSSRLVVAHLSQGGSFYREGTLLVFAALLGYKTAAHLHGSSFARFAFRRRWLVKSVLSRAGVVNVLSQESRDVVRAISKDAVISRVPNAFSEGARRTKSRTILFAGEIGERKGVDVLLQAWRSLDDRRGWRLLLAGPVSESFTLGALPEAVEYLGALGHEDLMDALADSGIAVLPSRAEAMPVFLVEAMSRGNAVVSSTVGGVPELIGDAGVLVKPGEVDSLASALNDLVGNDSRVLHLQEAALDRFRRHYSSQAIIPQLQRVWRRAVNGTAP